MPTVEELFGHSASGTEPFMDWWPVPQRMWFRDFGVHYPNLPTTMTAEQFEWAMADLAPWHALRPLLKIAFLQAIEQGIIEAVGEIEAYKALFRSWGL